MLQKERKRLQEADNFVILDYIKTSIEILMNMKMEEHENAKEENRQSKKTRNNAGGGGADTDTESMRSMDEPPKDYE